MTEPALDLDLDLDLDRLRQDTAACQQVVHLNHAGSSPSPRPVVETVVDHLHREATIGGYEAAAEAADRLDGVYASVARLVGGQPDEIALVESATRGWSAAFHGLDFRPGQRILTGRAEYVSNAIAMLQVAERRGVTIDVVDDDETGQIDLDELGRRIDDDVALIALTHVPTSSGLVNPAEAVGGIANEAGIPYLLDACQSAGQIDLDVARIGCDVLTATGRKFLRAPRGTGFAWVRRGFIERIRPLELDSRSASWTSATTYTVRDDARRLESWESSIAGRLGLGVAVDYALDIGVDRIEARVTAVAELLRAGLGSIEGVVVRDQGRRRCGIVTFTVDGVAPHAVRQALADDGINVWVSDAAHARFDLGHRGLDEVVRASVHYLTTSDEVERAVAAVRRCSPQPS
jgi:cysteine desulfurase / selenocysteine lyase